MPGNYWQAATTSRIARRRALALTAGGVVGSAFLAACGGSDSDPATTSGSGSSLVAAPADTTDKAKPGGVYKAFQTGDPLHFDPLTSNSARVVNPISVLAFLRPLKFTIAKYPKEPDGGQEGELMESWEVAPDKLSITLKLRQGVKWDSRAPTNGRAVDVQDVLFSWRKYAAINPGAGNVAYDATKSPGAPIESLSSPDEKTIVIKLRRPDANVLTWLSSAADGLWTMPRESESQYDPKTTLRGNGPWQMEQFTPSVGWSWRKNPDFYIKGRPFPDRIEVPVVSEAAQQQAQFRTGAIYQNVFANNQEAVLQAKKDVPAAQLMQEALYPVGASWYVWFGYEGNSPFKDVRARQALSMMLDREAFHDAINNAAEFRGAGLDATGKQPTVLGVGWTGYWLDPQGRDFGDNAKYLKLDPAEAKKLIAAAGLSKLDFNWFYNREPTYGPAYARVAEIYAGMFDNAGATPKQEGLAYQEFLGQYYFGYIQKNFLSGAVKGHNGALLVAERPFESAVQVLAGAFHSNGGSFHGLSPDGKDAHKGDPKLNDMIDKIRSEFDRPKQQSLTHEAIRYITGQTYAVPRPMAAKPYSLTWPVLGNFNAFSRYANHLGQWTEDALAWWIDDTKPPLKA